MKNKLLRRTIAIIMTLGMLLGSVSGHVTPVFATGEEGDTIVTEASQEETQEPTEPEAPIVVETEETTTAAPPAEEPTPEVTTEAVEEPTAPETEETTTAAPETEEPTTAAPTEPTTAAPTEPTTAAPTEPTTAPEETKEKTVKELVWDGGTVKITVSRKDGAEIPESSTLKVETLNSMNQSKSEEEELSIIKSFYEPAIDKIADEYGLDKASEAYKALVAGLLPFAVSIKDKDGKETVPEMNVKIEVKDSSNELYDLVYNKQTREIRVAEFDAYKNATLLRGDKASVSFDTAKGTYTAAVKTSNAAKYVVILYIDNDKVREAQPKAAEQKDDSEEETDGEDADPDSEQPVVEEEPVVEETPAEEPEEVVEKSDRLLGGRMYLMDADDDDFPERLKALADSYYGPDGHCDFPPVYVNISDGPLTAADRNAPSALDDDGFLSAGDTVYYRVEYALNAAQSWPGAPYALPTPLYDYFYDISMDITMPAGLIMEAAGDNYDIVPPPGSDRNLNSEHTYSISIPKLAPDEQGHTLPTSGSFFIQVYVGNNGTANSINTYNLADRINFEAKFDLLDKRKYETDPGYVVYTYTDSDTAGTDPIKTKSPDIWGAEKSKKSDAVVENGTATYTWTVAVGMRSTATGPLLTKNNDYNYNGRDGVTSITLTEALDAIFSKDNTHKNPTSVTIKRDGSTADPTVIDMSDPTVTIWGSGVSNDLKMNSMKLDADGDGSMTGSQDPESPVYTTYTITAVYSTTGLESDFFEAKNTLTSTNTVTMTANLANKEPQSETKSAPSPATMPVKDPASVNIRKYLQPGNGGSQEEYNNSKYGPITYTITKTDNSQFKVYTRSGTAPNYTYSEYANAQSVTLQPSIGNTVYDYYFLPGEYKITETIDPGHVNDMSFVSAKAQKTGSNTPVNGSNSSVTFSPDRKEAWTATFTNKECRGSIKINKNDGFATDSQPLAHAFFELTYPNGTKQTLETNDSGVATFSDLPYGTYILSEKSAPAGYAVNNEANGLPKTIVIGDAQANYEYTFGNDITKAYVNLKKYVFRTEPTDTAKANDETLNQYLATGNNQNCATFVLQRSTNGTSWETAKDLNDVEIPAQSLNAQGQINLEVPSKDKNTGATYYYRFVETIKANDDGSYSYYPIEENPAGTFTNKPTAHTNTSLPQSTTAGGTMTFKMFNRQKVAVQVYKHYYHYGTNGAATNGAVTSGGVTYHESTANWTVPVTLYRYSGTGDPTSASQLTAISTLNAKSSSTEAKWTDLVVYGENVTYTYYVKETLPTSGNGSDYTYFGLNTGSGYSYNYITFEDDENKEKYVKIDTSVVKSTYEVGFRNYLDAIPVRIRKFVGASGQTTLDGCSVTIYTDEACTQIATDAETGASLQNVTLPRNTTGAYIFLKSGQKYYYVETGIKPGYTFLNIQTDSGTSPSTVNKGVIDLTGNTQPAMANAGTKYKLYDVRNKQNPGVLFTKKTMGRREEISGAKFDIYTRTGAGTESDPYVYTLAASLDMSSASTANVSLPAGTYYVTETQTPTGYLNPNTATTAAEYNRVATLYNRKVDGQDNPITYYYDAVQKKTFTEITVSDTNTNFTFYNIYLKEKVQVQKRVDGANVSIPGFMVGIYKTDGNGNIVGDVIQTKMTDNNGLAKFDDLDVYDADGNRIIYKVLEEDPSTWSTENNLANKYYKVADGQTFKLEIQTSSSSYNTKDLNGNTLTVDNATKLTVKVTKWQFDGYEYFHGGLRFKMEGVTIGLYRRLAGETEWVFVDQKDTDPDGQVAFDGLLRANAAGTKYEYALVELNSNDQQYFPYFDGSVHDDAYPSGTGNLTDADLANYNSKVITAAQIGTDTEYDLGEMENSNHWVQFHLRKWLDGKSMQQNIAAGIGDASGHRRPGLDPAPGAAGTGDTLLDDCVYSLYRMELSDGQTTVAFSRSDPWECIGTYTTGQLLDLNGDPVKAEFLSDIDTGINKNYVYVMVEDNVGPNGCIPNPYYVYTFWYSDQFEPNSITCTVNGVQIAYTFQYQMDTINHEETLNSQGEGPGTSNILLAALRLAKWKDIYDANGNPSKVYEPLSNAQFEMSMTIDGQTTVIAYLTSGLNLVPTASGTQELAMAMSGTYQLILPGHKVTATEPDATHYYLKEYEVEGSATGVSYDVNSIVVELSDPDYPDYNIYGIPVTINEVGAPEGFGYSQRDYDTYLIFVDKAPGTQGNKFRFYSDLYFVKTTDKTISLAALQQGRLWYATDADDVEVGDGPIQRIVDYPMTNISVDIVKVGYAPSAATVELANTAGSNYSEEIATGNYGSKPLVGVTMKLQRYDEEEKKFKDWDYTVAEEDSWGTKTFTTNEVGRFFFPHGLPMGKYRVYETSLGSNDAEYENAYLQSANHYREFTVGGVPVTIYMANPEKIDLKINKINLGTNSPVTGMTFKLNNITATEDPAGTYTFSNLATGSYKLTETGPANISTKFFVDMFKASYPDLEALVGDGMTLGLTYAESAITVPGEEGEEPKTVGYDVKVTAITPWESNQIPQLEVKNPPKTNITLKKYNLADYNTADPNPLAGAEFIYFSKPLESITGNITLPTIPDGTATADVRDMFTAAGWTDETEDPVSVPADGKLFENLEPGVYVFFETGAPSGYDIPVAGNNYVLYTAVVTGGLDFNYTVSPSSVMIGKTEVNTYFESKTGAAVTVKAYDPQKASLKAQKSVSSSELGNADINNWSVTLELYEQLNNDGVITYSLVGSATINKANQSNPVTFRKGTATAYFSIGKTYYLKEVVNNNSEADADHFIWTSYKLGEDGRVINVTDPNDYYPVEVNSVEGFTIYVTNQYLYGRVDFLKYNADKTELLSGAQFVVQHEVSEGVWEDIVGATVVEMMNGTEGTGRYKAFIPLDGPEDHVYRIKETQAPPNFVINPDPTKDHIDVTLSFANNYENFTVGEPSDGTYLTNEEGNDLEITKYTNVHGATNIAYASSRTAKFTLYHWNTETLKWEWVADEEVEGTAGKILFDGPNMLAPGEKYAVAETDFNHTLYNGLESIYWNNVEQELITIEAIGKTGSVEEVKNAFVFTNTGYVGTIELKAYNYPYIKPVIRKLDVGQYPEEAHANMKFKVIELPKGYDVTTIDDNAAEEMAKSTNKTDTTIPRVVFDSQTNVPVETTWEGVTGTVYGTTIVWEKESKDISNIMNDRWNPDKTYVLVEYEVGAQDATYDTMVKDDPRVEWYTIIDPVTDPDPARTPDNNPYIFTLTNINGVAGVLINKEVVENSEDSESDVVDGAVDTLLEKDRDVVYTIDPDVTGKNQMLRSFVLEEVGLTAGTPSIPDWEITKIIIGYATQELPEELGLDDADMKADVVFTLADGTEVTGDEYKNLDVSADYPLDAPTGAVSFTITYHSDDVYEATKTTIGGVTTGYQLAEGFDPHPTTVYMTIKKIPESLENPATEITQFTNKAQATLVYPKWGADGSKPTDISVTKDDTEIVNVNPVKLPFVDVTKSIDTQTAQSGHVVKYTLVVENKASSEVEFVSPVLIDILPTGVTYYSDTASGKIPTVSDGTANEQFDMTVIPKTGIATHSYTIDNVSYSDAESCVIFELKEKPGTGTTGLKPGSTVTIEFYALINESAVAYNQEQPTVKIRNDVYLSSAAKSYHIEGKNPKGYAFAVAQNADGTYDFGYESIADAADRNPEAKLHYDGVAEKIEKEGYVDHDPYNWVASQAEVPVVIGSSLNISKSVQGDQDPGFHETGVGIATRTVAQATQTHNETHGTVDWRLLINNGQTENADEITVGDVIPKINDDPNRESKWSVIFDHFEPITFMGEPIEETDYTIYYYTGDITTAHTEVFHSVKSVRTWDPVPNEDHPNWFTTIPADKESITAFMIVFRADLEITAGHTALITYHTLVKDCPKDVEFYGGTDPETGEEYPGIAYENATNDFYLFYGGFSQVTKSLPVSVTLLDQKVTVEGDVWIDEDWDNTQQSTGNRRDYSQYKIVQELSDAISFSITDHRDAASGDTWGEDINHGSNTNPGYGESVRHFVFSDLGPAHYVEGRQLYTEDNFLNAGDHKIDKDGALKGDDPFHYNLNAVLDNDAVNSIFTLVDAGSGHYMSDNPDTELTATAANSLDSNFLLTSSKASTGYYTYPFYIRYSNDVDQSKDIGFRNPRSLEIKKVAADDDKTVIEGAKFEIYGPFGDSEMPQVGGGTASERKITETFASGSPMKFSGTKGNYTVDPEGTITQLETDANGKIVVTGLNWWKEYDIVEVQTGAGYEIENATVTGDDLGNGQSTKIKDYGDGKFTLMVPSTGRSSSQNTDKVTVHDPRYVDIQLNVEKIVETFSEDEFTFDFSYWVANITPAATAALNADLGASDADPIDTMSLTLSGNKTSGTGNTTGSFDELTLCGAGVYKFIIKEDAPDPLPTGWTYDPEATRVVTVTVTWDDTQKKLVAAYEYDDYDTIGGKDYEKFTNEYVAEGSWTPVAYKTVEGRPIVPGEFTFTVKEGDTTVSTGSVNADGTITFTEIDYDLSDLGTHTYVITEDPGNIPGMTYSTASITATVKLEVVDGEIKATEETYDPADQTFVNTWHAEGEWEPTVWKILEGRDFNEGEEFTVTVKEGNDVKMTGTVTMGKNGVPKKFSFNPEKITYTEADVVNFEPTTFTYTISETIPAQNPSNGVTFDVTVYTVNVTIALIPIKNADGDIIGYEPELDVTDDAPDSIEFINTYKFEPTSDQPKVTKKMTGETTVQDLTFEFTLKAISMKDADGNDITDGSFEPATATTPIPVGKEWTKEITIPRGSSTKFEKLFDSITYKKVGTYVYEIRETVEDNNNNIIFDDTVWTYTVEVTDDLQGSLVAVGSYQSDDGDTSDAADFINEYVPTPTELPLWVEKVLTGEPLHDADNTWFEFNLEFEKATVTGGYELPAETSIKIQGTDVEAGGDAAKAKFGNIKFTAPGVYDFLISETIGTLPKVYYDTTVWRATVTVVDYPPQGTYPGGLEATVVYTNLKTSTPWSWAKFTNDYTPEDVTYIPEVQKILVGEPRPEDPEDLLTFYFKLELVSQVDTKGKPITENGVTIPAGGDSTYVVDNGGFDPIVSHFGQLTFHKKGTYTFKITELPGTNGHYVYDEHTWTLVVVVKDDADGNLILDPEDPVYKRDDDTTNDYAEFKNQYTPDPVEWYPSAKKLMDKTGEPTVVDKEFTFNLTADANNPAGAEILGTATVTVTVPAGSYDSPIVNFGNIKFTKAGTFKFHVVEEDGGLPGIVHYDDTDTVLTVEITNIHDQLTVTDVSAEGNVDIDGIVTTVKFMNKYVPTPTEWQAKVRKLMNNSEPTVSEKTFTFTLKATKVVEKGAFQPADAEDAIVTDQTWTKTITVPQGATINGSWASAFEVFDKITFKKAGDYQFTITEEIPDPKQAGIVYAGDEVTVDIKVEDQDGWLKKTVVNASIGGTVTTDKAVVTIENDETTPDPITTVSVDFTNRYEVKPVYYTPPVVKNVTVDFGPTVAEKIFTFDLELISAENKVKVEGEADPKPIDVRDGASIKKDSVTIVVKKGETAADAMFKQIRFSKAGTYVYKITEKIPTGTDAEEGITYTTVEWTMTVVVTDTDTGNPSALELTSVTYAKAAPQAGKTPQQAADDGDDIQSVQTPDEKAGDDTETPTAEKDADADSETEDSAKIVIADDEVKELIGIDEYVFINDYKPEPVEWIPEVEKLLSDDSSQTKVDRIFDFEMKRLIKAAAGTEPATEAPGDAKAPEETKEPATAQIVEPADGCWLVYDMTAQTGTTEMDDKTTLYARTTLEATKDKTDPADWKSDPSRFYPGKDAATGAPTGDPVTLTFDKAGTYYFTVQEIMPTSINDLYPGFEYDVTVKEIAVTVTDIDGKLIISLVTITDPSEAPEGGSASAKEVYKVKITEKTETDENGVERTTFETEVVIPTPAPEDPIVITTVPVTNHYYLGKLEITKHLIDKEDVDEDLQNGTERILDPTTFVFNVEATWSYPGYEGSVKVYSNVVSIVFNEAGSQTATIEGIPVGSTVTVKEIYTGGNYDLVSDQTVTVTVVRDDPLTTEEEKAIANFDNEHNGNWKDGGSVTNSIGANGSGTATYADGRVEDLAGGGSAEPEE